MKGFIDTNIFIYTLEKHPRFGIKSKNILEKVDSAEIQAYTSTLTLQEICWYLEADQKIPQMREAVERILNSQVKIIQVPPSGILEATKLKQNFPKIELNDLINYSLMKIKQIKRIYTNDRHFDKLPDIQRTF
ncbi:MAG: type II toxin-antitoxin system VapC family toxin [Thermoproteota archaeon]